MHNKLMRFRIVKDDREFDAFLDERLSFVENFAMMNNISDFDLDGFRVYDPKKKMFLNCEIPIEIFNISSFMIMYLF